jgi:hypothetical protein
MWNDYIDMLARDRFNVLDLHGGYSLKSTGFPNLYPLLVHVPEYPNVGNTADQAKNLAAFKAIVEHARERGVYVAFMNYSASVNGVPKEKLADYTAKAVAELLKQVPNLYMLGFRVGETGQPASFFQDAYLKGVAESGSNIRLYTRSWLTTRDQLEAIGKARNGAFDIEIKYNGEQLGLPYQALHGGFGSYSYEDYLNVPASYRIIWQVRADGTHRFWDWEDTNFIRRTVRTFALGNARGFTLEPEIAYFTPYAAAYYKQPADQAVYHYIWQRHWAWYLAWGRLSYNPELPEQTLVAGYGRRYGNAGDRVYRAVQASGTIVPLALSYRFQGPDQRNFSPETETGTGYNKKAGPFSFADAPMDNREFVGIRSFVDEKLAGVPDGRIGPAEVAGIFARAAQNTREAVAAVGNLSGRAGDEWRLEKVDLLSASYLADYYSARILGSLHLDYARHTGSQTDYEAAVALMAVSRAAWKQLANTADAVYAPLDNRLRGQVDFQWANELPRLEKLDATLPAVWAKRGADPTAVPLRLTPADLGQDTGIRVTALGHDLIANGQVRILCQATAPAGIRVVKLWYMPMPSENKWTSRPMAAGDAGQWERTVPITAEGLIYCVEVQDQKGQASYFPNVLQQTPYQAITPAEVAGIHD